MAAKVPAVLKQCVSFTFEKFNVSVGWRSGDTASLFAGTAEGQAVAMLMLCLSNVYRLFDCGVILDALSKELIIDDRGTLFADDIHLSWLTAVISSKMDIFAYGNHLAHYVTQLYLKSGFEIPICLLETFRLADMARTCKCISTTLCDPDSFVTFTGHQGSGHLFAMLIAMCPDDCLIKVKGSVLHSGSRNKIILNVDRGNTMIGCLEENSTGVRRVLRER
jgi:hypothetical protein